MGSDLYIAASGAAARLRDLEIVANNLANSTTTGFKRDVAVFEVALAARMRNLEDRDVRGPDPLNFVDTQEVVPDLASGSVRATGAPLDVALRGPGWFEIETPEGRRYTRAGSFAVNAQGELSTAEGHPVLGAGGAPLSVTRTSSISAAGDIVDATGQVAGRIGVVTFDDPSRLEKLGQNLFKAPDDATPTPAENAEFAPRSLEQSNVVPVKELSTLVLLQRAFELDMQALRKDDETTQALLQEIRS